MLPNTFPPPPPPPPWPADYSPGVQFSLDGWLRQAWRTFQARPVPFVLWALVLMAPGLAVNLYRLSRGTLLEPSPGPASAEFWTAYFVSLACTIALIPLQLGGNLYALSLQRGHRPPAIKFLQPYGRGLAVAGTLVLVGVLCLGVFLLLLLPVGFVTSSGTLTRALVGVYLVIALPFTLWIYIYLALGWMFAPLLVVDRGLGPIEAMRGSWYLVHGRRWRMLLLLLLLVLIALVGLLACFVGTLVTAGLVAGLYSAAYRDLSVAAGYPDTDPEL
ncbi:MAG TPA: hypothetical protein VMS93_00545 [Candidatus Saccharimonadales bacterium]|nr:hypothetical protein [Candidatus Saccharimonadales bacterium]